MLYLFRKGDGNDGNYPRKVVDIPATEDPWAALKALVANEYIAGKRVRRHIIRHCEVDGEREYGVHAMVADGPDGETAYEAAWLTAELQPLSEEDAAYYSDRDPMYHDLDGKPWTLKRVLDGAAWKLYRRERADFLTPRKD